MSAADPESSSLILLRHASAGRRSTWTGDDSERPLDSRGRTSARALLDTLARYDITRIVSSPARRCIETLEPLAEHLQLGIELRPELAIEHENDVDASRSLLDLFGDMTLVCTHREFIAELVGAELVPTKGDRLVVECEAGMPVQIQRAFGQRPELEPA